MRVYEVAKEFGIPNKDLLAKIRALGLEVNNHMSSLDADAYARIKRSIEKERTQSTTETRVTAGGTVLRRRSARRAEPKEAAAHTAAVPAVRRRAAAVEAPPPAAAEARPPAKPARRAKPAAAVDAPVAAEAAPAPEPARAEEAPAAPAPTPAPEPGGDGAAEPRKSRVIISAPGVMARPQPPAAPEARAEAPAPVAPPPAAAEAQAEPSAPSEGDGGAEPEPTTVADFAENARSRFEAELQRARARVAEREAEEASTPAPTEEAAAAAPASTEPRDPSRPAVGSIISLPTRIKITERAPTGRPPPPGANQIRGRFAQQQRGGPGRKGPGRDYGRKKLPLGKKGKQTILTTPAEHKRVIRIEDTIAVSDLAHNMGIKATEVLKKLWGMGMTGVNINASIDLETSQLLASEFGYEVQNVAFKEADIFADKADEPTELQPRAPVVTVMGHVDHGKTSLLDAIRKTRVAAGEAGGITQHVAAYKVEAPGHGEIVFLDTPGHEAFTEMRARGAHATDIVVLVVAATDGAMPQTIEAINHAKDAKVTIIVAVNKIDLPEAQPERIRQQLADHGLIPEEWGGDTIYVDVSALKGQGIDKLLESISLSAEVLELKANPDKRALGVVIEARLDRSRGPMATVLVQEGTLRVGETVVAGRCFGKVRAMLDDTGQNVKEVGPSTPVELLGLDGVPEAGDSVNVVDDDKIAKEVVEHRRQSWRKRELATTAKVSLENIMERINEGEVKELKIVLKADVQGSAEALKAALVKLSGEKVKVNVISAGVGGVTESDVNLAKAGNAIIVGFHVRPAGKSAKLAEQEGVEIRLYDIIYDALDEVKSAMAGLLAPIKREVAMGKLEVRDTFQIPKVGMVAGCMVTEGKVTRKALLRIIRDAVQIYEGRVGSLRRFKDDVADVQNGYECGVMVAGFNDLKAGDEIEAYEVVEEAAQL